MKTAITVISLTVPTLFQGEPVIFARRVCTWLQFYATFVLMAVRSIFVPFVVAKTLSTNPGGAVDLVTVNKPPAP